MGVVRDASDIHTFCRQCVAAAIKININSAVAQYALQILSCSCPECAACLRFKQAGEEYQCYLLICLMPVRVTRRGVACKYRTLDNGQTTTIDGIFRGRCVCCSKVSRMTEASMRKGMHVTHVITRHKQQADPL
jgi:hypothetical protein